MLKISIAVVGIAMSLMAATAMFAGRNGPPASASNISDAQMTMETPPSFVVKPDSKLKGLTHHRIDAVSTTLILDQATAPVPVTAPASDPPATPVSAPVATPTATPVATPTAAPASTPATPPAVTPQPQAAPTAPKAAPAVAPPGVAPFLSTDLTTDHTRTKGGFLNFLRFIISSVARFMNSAEDNLWVVMLGVAGILFLTTGFWQYHAISESRRKKPESGGVGGACGGSGCSTKGPCH